MAADRHRMRTTATPHRPTVADVRALFGRDALWQSWLEIEAALAEVQAEMGIIPATAGAEIRSHADLTQIDAVALAADIARTRAPIVSLTRALAAACAGDAGGYVHWGATTQNVMQTGRTLLMRRAHSAFMACFLDVLRILADLAEAEAETVTVARTNHRHALPITFGFKVAAWIEEWLRHLERFRAAEGRVFSAQWGGAVGAMHAVGPLGPELNRRLAARLGLGWLTVPSRAGLDYIGEYFLLLGLFSTTCSKIAAELYATMSDEIDELYEDIGEDVVGSSTMPHKVNPKVAVTVIALAARVRAQVPLALEGMQPSFEGDGATNQMLAALIDEACPLAYELVVALCQLLGCIRLKRDRMRDNVGRLGEALASEQAMMALAPLLGRGRAHDLLHHAIGQAQADGITLADALLRDPSVAEVIAADELRAALDPMSYVGLSPALTADMVHAARLALDGAGTGHPGSNGGEGETAVASARIALAERA